MKVRWSGARALGVAALLAIASSASGFSSSRLYTIQAYLDCVPSGATVIDRVAVTGGGASKRQLLVTVYRNAGDVPVANLSQEPMSPYWVRGNGRDVTRLFAAPKGTEIRGTFVLYREAMPSLLIADLDLPASEPIADARPDAASRCAS